MGAIDLLKSEFRKLLDNKALMFALIGVLLIPIIYVAVLLSAKWGPYDNMDNLPVAVVNNDAGAVSDGSPINVGNDLVETLKASPTLGWKFVTSEEAEKGLDSNKYYMVVEIPEDFSQKVTTVLDENPQVPEIRYTKNEGMNFMAAQVTNSAVERIREQLGDKITATFASTVFSKFPDIADGFLSGADGSKQIKDGTIALSEGTETMLSSLKEKAPDITRLAEGAKTADAGAGTLLSSVKNGTADINRLADGAGQVATGAAQLQSQGTQVVLSGLEDLKPGTNQILDGLKQVVPGANSLVQGLENQMVPGAKKIATGIATINSNLDALEGGAQTIAGGVESLKTQVKNGAVNIQTGAGAASQYVAGVKQALTALNGSGLTPQQQAIVAQAMGAIDGAGTAENPGLANVVNSISAGAGQLATSMDSEQVGGLVNGAKTLAGGLAAVKAGFRGDGTAENPGLVTGSATLASGMEANLPNIKTLSAGASALLDGQQRVVAGVNSLAAGQKEINNKAKQLAAGAGQVSAGTGSLTNSWATLTNGVSQLKDGTAQIAEGNATVATGWSTLIEGTTQLNEGAGKLSDGSEELATGLEGGYDQVSAVKAEESNIQMFSTPVNVVGDNVNGYSYYRDSTAPYILSLALFVSLLVLSFFIDFKKPAQTPSSAFSWYLSKWLKLATFAIAQALLLSIFVLLVLGLSVSNVMLFILFTIFVSLTFMSIIFFLVAVGGNIGRFIGLVFIVLQLSITGSNLPIDMLPENLRTLSQFLPLTYSNAGFKSIISLGDTSFLFSNATILAIYFVVASILALVVFLVSFKSYSSSASGVTSNES